nr:hypothetical protein [Pirellulaceae bacterium]
MPTLTIIIPIRRQTVHLIRGRTVLAFQLAPMGTRLNERISTTRGIHGRIGNPAYGANHSARR